MSADTAVDLKEYGVKVFSIYPGSVATEGMKELAKYDPSMNVSEMESPQFVGLCVAALALDEKAIEESGSVVLTSEVAEKHGFTDTDGKQPKPLEKA
jgi:dehydrogenase/reductase SDR family protein 1